MSSETFKPDWDKVYALSEKLDEAVDEGITKNNLSFIEIDMALYLVKEKIEQEKHRVLNHMLKEDEDEGQPFKSPPDNFYR